MNTALSSDVRKVDETPEDAAHAAVTYTIKVLSSAPGEGGREVRTVLFSRTSRGESIEISAETDAPNLLAKLPDFLDAAMEIQRSLWPAQRSIAKIPPRFFPRLAEESRLLRWLAEGAPEAERVELDRRRVLREAMIVRDIAWEAIRNVLPADRRLEIDVLVGLHETSADLAASMDAIAALIDTMLGDPEDAAILGACEIDGAYATALRRHATALRAITAPPEAKEPKEKRPRVLRLIGVAYRALRTDAFVALSRGEDAARV